MNCPHCQNPAKIIMVNGRAGKNFNGETIYHCCGKVFTKSTPITPKEASMKKPGKRSKR